MEAARLARLGVVVEPEIGHESFAGRLSIPYITKTGVVDLRFRSLNPAVEPKYMGMTGAETRMFNVLDIERAGDFIGVCEGELDTITLLSYIDLSTGSGSSGQAQDQSSISNFNLVLSSPSKVLITSKAVLSP